MKHIRTIIVFIALPLLFVYLFYNFLIKEEAELKNDSTHQITSVNIDENNIDGENTKRFIFIGDTGTGNENQYAVADAIEDYCNEKQDCQSVFILGDVIYPEGVVGENDVAFIEKFESPYKNIELPFYILFGNHDYLGCTDCYLEHGEQSSKWVMPDRYYKVESEEVDFYALDTEVLGSEQLEWLRSDLKENDEGVDVVLGHRPILSYEASKYGEDWSGREELKEVVCDTAELYISGHAHMLEDIGKVEGCSFVQLISGGGGAYIRDINEPFEGGFYHTGYGFLSIIISNESMNYEFVDINGKVLHQNKIGG